MSKTFDSTRKYLKIELRMPPLVGVGKFPVFIMAPVLMFSWQEKYSNH